MAHVCQFADSNAARVFFLVCFLGIDHLDTRRSPGAIFLVILCPYINNLIV